MQLTPRFAIVSALLLGALAIAHPRHYPKLIRRDTSSQYMGKDDLCRLAPSDFVFDDTKTCTIDLTCQETRNGLSKDFVNDGNVTASFDEFQTNDGNVDRIILGSNDGVAYNVQVTFNKLTTDDNGNTVIDTSQDPTYYVYTIEADKECANTLPDGHEFSEVTGVKVQPVESSTTGTQVESNPQKTNSNTNNGGASE